MDNEKDARVARASQVSPEQGDPAGANGAGDAGPPWTDQLPAPAMHVPPQVLAPIGTGVRLRRTTCMRTRPCTRCLSPEGESHYTIKYGIILEQSSNKVKEYLCFRLSDHAGAAIVIFALRYHRHRAAAVTRRAYPNVRSGWEAYFPLAARGQRHPRFAAAIGNGTDRQQRLLIIPRSLKGLFSSSWTLVRFHGVDRP